MDKRDFKVGDLVRYKGELLTVSPLGVSFSNLGANDIELIESVEDRIARFTQKEEEVKPKIGDLIESNGEMKFHGAYSSLFLTEPTKIIETHKERLNRFKYEKGKIPKKEFLIGDLVRCDGKLQVIDVWSGLHITQESSLIVETHEERLARFTPKEKEFEAEVGVWYKDAWEAFTKMSNGIYFVIDDAGVRYEHDLSKSNYRTKMEVKSIERMLKQEAKIMGWNVKKAVYLKHYDRLYDKNSNLIYKEGKFNTPKK